MEQHISSAIQRDIQQCTIPFIIMPTNQQTLSISGPVDVSQPVISFHDQITCLARGSRAKLDLFLFRAKNDDCALRTIGGQTPITVGSIDFRGACACPAPHIEAKRFRGIFFCDAVQAECRWQTRTLHVPDADVFQHQAGSSSIQRDRENG